jgi:transcriptional regulator with XRE-family HTH domain
VYKMLGRFSELKDEEARYAYADTVNNAFLRAQIEQLRKERGFSQEKLAELVGTKQSGISRWLNSGFSTCKVESLRKFAKAYGVRLRISLEEFGTLPSDVEGFTKDRLTPRKFEDDPAFKEPAANEPEPEEVLVEAVGNPVVLPPPITGLGLGSVDQGGIERVRGAAALIAASAASWLRPAGSMGAHEGFANPGVPQQLMGLGLSQSPMSRILSLSVSDSTAVSDAVGGEVESPSGDEVLLGASDSNPTPGKKEALPNQGWFLPKVA